MLPNPIGRHLIFVSIAHFDVITEDVVKTYLQACYACGGRFSIANLLQVVFARCRDAAQLVEFRIYTRRNHIAAIKQHGWIRHKRFRDQFAQCLASVECRSEGAHLFVVGVLASALDEGYTFQRQAQLLEFARIDSSHGRFGNEALHVAHTPQAIGTEFGKLGRLKEIFHAVLSLLNHLNRPQREEQPPAQEASAHRRERAVYNVQERTPIVGHRAEEFQIAHGKLIHPDEMVFFDPRQAGNVTRLFVLRQFEISHNGAGRGNGSL